MRIESFEWDDSNVSHIQRHEVEAAEAEEIFDGRVYIARTWKDRYLALGRTASGRYLVCIFEKTLMTGEIRVVTARDMDRGERKLYKIKS